MIRHSPPNNEACIADEDPLTPEEQRLFEISLVLDEAFRRDPSIAGMNRVYRRIRTGNAETDRAIRDQIGMFYLLERAKPALRKAMQQREATNGRAPRHRESVEMEAVSS